MKKIITVIMFFSLPGILWAQSNFTLPSDGKWYKVVDIGGQHGYLEYICWHTTGNNPSMAKGEIQFINSRNIAVQHHQTMGYGAWNQPQFALLNLGNTSELWVKATNGIASGTFKILNSLNINITGGTVSDANLSDNGGTLTIYDKLSDDTHTFTGNLKMGPLEMNGDLTVGVNNGTITGKGANLSLLGASENTDPLTLYRYNISDNYTELRVNVGDDNVGEDAFVVGNSFYADGQWKPFFTVRNNGNVGIGTTQPDAKLAVKGTVHAQEVKVDLNGAVAPDYVFEPSYLLPPLDSVQSYINQNKHLPEVPSAKEMEANGVNLGQMNMLLLKKVEELTLYLIQLKTENEKLHHLSEEIAHMNEEINLLKNIKK